MAHPTSGLDTDMLEMTLDAIGEFAQRHLPESRILELDRDDTCPVDIVRGMCGEELGIQLLFIPELYGGMGGSTYDVYRICERMARIDMGIATSVLATFLGSDPIFVGGTDEQKQALDQPDRGRGDALGVRGDRARGGQRPRLAAKTVAKRVLEDGRVVGYRSTAASNGSATAASPTRARSSPTRPAGRAGSSSSRGPRASHTASPRTSTESALATPRRCSSTTSTSTSIGSSAARRARASPRRSRFSATPG